jgi:hypothetical protein
MWRRRFALAIVVGGAIAAAGCGGSPTSGPRSIAEVLGVDDDDPTLASVREIPGAPRGIVRVTSGSGQRFTFAAFHVQGSLGSNEPAICFALTRDDERRLNSLGCSSRTRAADWQQTGQLALAFNGDQQAGGLRVTDALGGLVPESVRRVTLRREGEVRVRASLSEPFARSPDGLLSGRLRAFLAVGSRDEDDGRWLLSRVRRTLSATFPGGASRRTRLDDLAFFPMIQTSAPVARRPRMRMQVPAKPAPWHSVGYPGKRGSLCNAAAPVGERLIRLGLLQCSSAVAVVNAVVRFGAAPYLSNPNPRRERGPGAIAVFGFTRADAASVTTIDQRGQRWQAKLSSSWTIARRRGGDLAGTGELRRRLSRLPRSARVRSFLVSLAVPPRPDEGKGLRMQVRLRDGRVLAQP